MGAQVHRYSTVPWHGRNPHVYGLRPAYGSGVEVEVDVDVVVVVVVVGVVVVVAVVSVVVAVDIAVVIVLISKDLKAIPYYVSV